MKSKLFTLIVFSGLFLCVNAQIDVNERIKKERVVRGIVIEGDEEIEGYIKKVSETRSYDGKTYKAYDNFQSVITFISKEEFETTEKLKGNMYVKYKPEDIDGYKYFHENGNVLTYESVIYSDLSDVSLRMIPKKKFLRVESKGKLSIYTYFIPLPSAMVGDSYIKKCYEDAETPITVYRRANQIKDSPKMLEYLNIEKELADCPKVVKKYKDGEYNVIGKKGTESKFMKAMNKLAANEEMKYAALMEYNSGICDGNE